MKEKRRKLKEMPFDKVFEVDGNRENCHCTGFEVCLSGDDPKDQANWWNEYVDHNGDFHYGR